MRRIGVIGCGVVGSAVLKGFVAKGRNVVGYDKYKEQYRDFRPIVDTDIVFVCVPTATREDGSQDIQPLRETLSLLKSLQYRGVIVVKSTVLPGTTEYLAKEYDLKKFCHNPEFLTAATPFEDFMDQKSIIIGSTKFDGSMELARVYNQCGFAKINIYPSATITELAKYQHNVTLAVKVAISNEIHDIARHVGVAYDHVRDAACSIGGIGPGHTKVPGPDGYGYSGMCFPKDCSALLNFAKDRGINVATLEGAEIGNKIRRGVA